MLREIARARNELDRLDTVERWMSDELRASGTEGTRYLSSAWHQGAIRRLEQTVRHRLVLLQARLRAVRHAEERTHSLVSALLTALSHLFQVCPVAPPLSYVDDFGVVSLNGGRHIHQGIDIHAPWGTPVRAPFPGAAEVATNPVGGLAVTVRGAAGFVYNAHLSALGVLGPVEAGTVVGYVGNSGDAAGGPAHDHFEWHPGGGPAVDPFAYLNQAC